jgi:hypothetical protein
MAYKLKLLTYILAFLLFLAGCVQPLETDIPTIHAGTGDSTKLSSLFNSVTIVPLETHPEGLIGLYVNRIEVFEDKIFMFNERHAGPNILCFHSSGRFLFNIDWLGTGPQEYTILNDFFIDEKSENVVLSTQRRSFFRIDLSGQFSEIIQAEDIYQVRQMVYLNDSTVLAFNDIRSVLPGIDLLTLDAGTFNIRETSKAQNALIKILHPFLPISIHSDRVLYYALDTIFDVTGISNRKAMYTVDFGRAHRVNMNTLVRHAETMSYDQLLDRIRNMLAYRQLFFVLALFENSRFLVINYDQNRRPSNKFELERLFLLHDKESGKTYNSNNIAFDTLNLPDMGEFNILGKYDEAFYAIFTPDWTPQNRERMLQSEHLSEELRQHIREADEEANPWLVILK